MAGCGRPWNGNHVVTGVPLRCGQNLYWKVPGKDKERTQEAILCDECTKKEEQ
jgi:hypothetical protein